jgi:hypothetical protein
MAWVRENRFRRTPARKQNCRTIEPHPAGYTSSEQHTHDLVTMPLTTLMTLLRLSVFSILWQRHHALSLDTFETVSPAPRFYDDCTIPQFHNSTLCPPRPHPHAVPNRPTALTSSSDVSHPLATKPSHAEAAVPVSTGPPAGHADAHWPGSVVCPIETRLQPAGPVRGRAGGRRVLVGRGPRAG